MTASLRDLSSRTLGAAVVIAAVAAVDDRTSLMRRSRRCHLTTLRFMIAERPDSGWVSVRAGKAELVVPADIEPPSGGWKVLVKELPTAWRRLALPELPGAGSGAEGTAEAGPGSAVRPQCPQQKGKPYIFYRQVNFVDTKPTGLRMSACLAAMDDCRTDLFSICDQTVQSFRKVTDPFVQVAIELRPAIRQLGRSATPDGLLYTHQDSKGVVLSWLRLEAQFGWPAFPLRNEEQTLFLVGKQQDSQQRVPLATARFAECLVDDSQQPASALSGAGWEQDAEKFFARVKSDHSTEELAERHLHKLYRESNKPFAPTQFKQVSWLMSHSFGDLWSLLYHAKTPELLWDVNMLAGGSFAALVKGEPDPQAMVVNLPKKMEVGTVYDVFCFLDEEAKKACYVLCPSGQASPSDCVLAVVAGYSWSALPADGRSLTSEDIQLVDSVPRRSLLAFASGSETPKASKVLDLSRLQR
mmetsp:Transcript_123984/g.396373  ORF Transcript_123984/g.396373 Transcript_123984/m.396373 type:complete len:470 (-) Transcript_123984:24-1433(-)